MTRVLLVALAACGSGAHAPADAAPIVPADAVPLPVPLPLPDAGIAAVPCPPEPDTSPAKSTDTLSLTETTFAKLPAWPDEHLATAIPSFLASCAQIDDLADDAQVGLSPTAGRARQWRHACAAARRVTAGDDAAAQAFFESEFTPYVAAGKDGPDGKFTSYAVQELHGSRTKHGDYQTPVWARPASLVSVDLATFINDPRGRHLWGRVNPKTGALISFPTRKEIRQGALASELHALFYVDDRVDALYAEIEGSGKVITDDGQTVWIEFAGKNGRAYKGVGKVLKELGVLDGWPGGGTMQGIRSWFAANPQRFDEIVDQDAAVVFFAESSKPGAVGSEGVIPTPVRSMAIDRGFVAFGTPIWVETRAPVPGQTGHEQPWHHLLVAQDTGGGILGPVRGDIYWGDDRVASEMAGRMGAPGRWWLLLPKGVR